MNARIFSPVSSEGTLICGRLKMEIKWWQTSKHTCWNAHDIGYNALPPRSRSGSGVIVQSIRNQQHTRNRMYTDVPECKSVDVNAFLSQLLFHINIHIYEPVLLCCIWNGAATDAECQHAVCNTFIQQHVHVDMHYFNTLILLERGNPEAYQLCCPCKSFFLL